ncbi:type VII toxin-antitoxin system MntA family adenylyltransferase antitoxin [Marinomonas ostreistagni]|uniref:type VII toxin-antitoxin system MntA family adenylyltransferase antitoxin n=1 Tax=Marinomonas ostreistagni TaxID=359209 RepID=UPI001951F446|nr:nucleotidyltransferase domain-containing protein [Marinomonas ostreistagni]MBM6550566.1 nucleotidyltransferase domain-containing protein [Marinomonas ostreistagni]
MLDKKSLIQSIQHLMPDVRLIYLFGSQADGSATPSSDIDVAVLLKKKLDPVTRFDLEQSLAIELNQDVDLVDLLTASTVLQNQVIMHGKLLFGSENEQAKFEMQVMSMYQHLNEERSDILQEYLK